MRRKPHPYVRGELVVVIDCSDLDRSAEFWTGVLGYARDGVAAGRYQALLPADGKGAEILLQQVPERKQGKNRVHLDLRTRELDRETERLVRLGAQVLTKQPVTEPDGAGTSSPTRMATSSACCSRRFRTGRTDGSRPDTAIGQLRRSSSPRARSELVYTTGCCGYCPA